MKPERTWLLLADGSRARLLERVGRNAAWRSPTGHDRHSPHARAHELGEDRPGRSFESVGAARHGHEPRSDPAEQAEVAFIECVAELLAREQRAGADDRLIVAASPRALGQLRPLLAPEVAALVALELDKDLTKLALEDVTAIVATAEERARG